MARITRREVIVSGTPRTDCQHRPRCARCKKPLNPNAGVMCTRCTHR